MTYCLGCGMRRAVTCTTCGGMESGAGDFMNENTKKYILLLVTAPVVVGISTYYLFQIIMSVWWLALAIAISTTVCVIVAEFTLTYGLVKTIDTHVELKKIRLEEEKEKHRVEGEKNKKYLSPPTSDVHIVEGEVTYPYAICPGCQYITFKRVKRCPNCSHLL